jgi:membrane dipeptidase
MSDARATALAAALDIPREAAELTLSADLIDLHIDTFIPPRLPLIRYDVFKRHAGAGRFFGHLDVPRMEAGGLSGAMWSITTNPFRSAASRWRIFQKNLSRFRGMVATSGGRLALVRDATEYAAARSQGQHAIFLSIQGGNALAAAPGYLDALPDHPLVRVTLVHLTNAVFGTTSSPLRLWRGRDGLPKAGRDFIASLNAHRVFVDLAHIHARCFRDAVEAHDKRQPLIATHTGVSGVKPHWRNLDDDQLRAIADTGGVIGVIFASNFLRPRGVADDADLVVRHMEHIVKVAGEDAVAVGSDYDGAIIPPPDLRDGLSYGRLVARMLARGWPEARIRKALGGNFLASLDRLRPAGWRA